MDVVGFVVLRGVVYFGYLLNVILRCVVCYMYGIKICLFFKFGEYLEDKKIIIDRLEWCKNVFFFFVRCGD